MVARFVDNVFSDKYKTTVGVNIKSREVDVPSDKNDTAVEKVKLIIWDIEGEQEVNAHQRRYAPTSQAFILVADSTRADSFDAVKAYLDEIIHISLTNVILLINKSDLEGKRVIFDDSEQVQELRSKGIKVFSTSAKLDMNVEEAFAYLSEVLLRKASE